MWVLERCIGHLGRWGDGGRREESMCASEYARDQHKHNLYHITSYIVGDVFLLVLCVGVQDKLVPQIFAFVNDRVEPVQREPQHTAMI